MTDSKLALSPLLSDDEVAAVLHHPGVVLLDTTWARSYEGEQAPANEYVSEHLPGARLFDFRQLRHPTSPLQDTVCSADQFQTLARELGISDQHVVCYSQGHFSGAARALWLFRLFGHRNVSLLDGGLGHWKRRGRPTTGLVDPVLPGRFVATPQPRYLSDLPAVEATQSNGIQLIDARPAAIFSGEKDYFAGTESPAAEKTGHIPGAKNLPTSQLLEDGLLLPNARLKSALEQAGVVVGRPAVASCSLGVGAAAIAFALELLGSEVAVFDGSWEAWAAAKS